MRNYELDVSIACSATMTASIENFGRLELTTRRGAADGCNLNVVGHGDRGDALLLTKITQNGSSVRGTTHKKKRVKVDALWRRDAQFDFFFFFGRKI